MLGRKVSRQKGSDVGSATGKGFLNYGENKLLAD
jgi:hypothetical protein